jgi:ferrous iron transport protein B
MEDEASSLGITIDKKKLSSLLGVPVVGSVAIQKKGLRELRENMTSLSPATYRPIYSHPEGSLPHLIHQERLKIVDSLLSQVLKKESLRKRGWASEMGRISMHPFWGVFILVGILFIFYEFVGHLGAQVGVDLLENKFFGEILNPWAIQLFSKMFFFSSFLRDLFVGPYGVITMALTYAFAIILPIVTTFFIAFSVIEDSGYLPRLSVMLNRMFRLIGLNGKAVVPMVLGLGCDTMATMSARIMDTRKEKIILTLLLALGVPCSAQLGIILGMLGSLPFWVTSVWLGVILTALWVVGFLSSKVLPGGRSDFVMEIPPIRRPVLFNIFTKTLARLEWYLREVVPLFVIGTLVLFFLDKFRWLPVIQKVSEPLVVRILNLPPQAAEAFLIGFLRRDYGATRFFDLYSQGQLDVIQTAVALIVITLFIPCLANILMIVKERGVRVALAMTTFIYPVAFLIGGIVNWGLRF